MAESELISILKSFSKNELRKLRDFLTSPYFNCNRSIISLYDLLVEAHPTFRAINLYSSEVYQSIYGSANFSHATMRNLVFRLTQLVNRFLTIESLDKNNKLALNLLLEELNRRYLKTSFLKNFKKAEKFLKSGDTLLGSDFLYSYFFEANRYNFYQIHDSVLRNKTVRKHLKSVNDAELFLTIFYVSELTCAYLNSLAYSLNHGVDESSIYGKNLLDNLNIENIRKLSRKRSKYSLMLKIYSCLLKTFQYLESEEYFFQYLKLIDKYRKVLDRNEASFHYSKIVNYCILKENMKSSKTDFGPILFKTYNAILDNKYYKNDKHGYLPVSLYRAILFLGLKLRKFNWIKNFIYEYSKEVPPFEVDNVFNFASAYYNYEMNKNEEALDYINKISVDYFIFKYDLKNLTLKICYELEYWELSLSNINSFKQMLNKELILSNNVKMLYFNFLRFLKQLILFNSGNNKIDIEFLYHKLTNEPRVAFKDWLIDKYLPAIKFSDHRIERYG